MFYAKITVADDVTVHRFPSKYARDVWIAKNPSGIVISSTGARFLLLSDDRSNIHFTDHCRLARGQVTAALLVIASFAPMATPAMAQYYNDPRPPQSPYDNPYDPNPGYSAQLNDQSDAITRYNQLQQQEQQNWRRFNTPGSPDFGQR